MKFVYCGYDFAIDTLMALLNQGHDLAGILTFPCDNIFSHNTRLHSIAQELSVPITLDKPNAALIDSYIAQGVTLFLCVGYAHKMPDIDADKAYGVNVHPALLPQARGMMPLPHVMMNDPDACGITVHKLSAKMDGGDILARVPMLLGQDDTLETIGARMAMRLPALITDIVADLPDMWAKAHVQDEALAFECPHPDDAMRMIDWSQTVDHSLRQARAFGRAGLLMHLDGDLWVAGTIHGWQEAHQRAPGDMCLLTPQEIVIAVQDGYLHIMDAQKIQQN